MNPSRMYGYVRARQLEGTYTSDPSTGVWTISTMRICKGWGSPTEEQWPYDGNAANWPPKDEPAQIDQAAKAFRIVGYQRARSSDDCRVFLSNDMPVIASFQIALQDWRTAPNGVVPMPSSAAQLTNSHTVTLVGHDDNYKQFKIRNSWGVGWGDRGYGVISYSFFEQYQLDAWVMVPALRSPTSGSGILVERWGIRDCLAPTPLHGIELFDSSNDECLGWAFMVERQGFADIEELFVRPAYRARSYGRKLAELILAHPNTAGRNLRLWVSHADQQHVADAPMRKILKRLGLSINRARRRWAPYVAM